MVKRMKIFGITDVHGHARAARGALRMMGFDSSNPDHLLVVGGDNFDRGTENLEVYSFLKGIKNKVLILGNHEDMLVKALKRGSLGKADYHNGTDITVEQFFGSCNLDPYGRILAPEGAKRELYDFIGGMYDYFETENYVFTHAWTPEAVTKDPAWRTAERRDWNEARWVEWNRIYPNHPKVEGKTVVCGHRSAWFGMTFDESRPNNSFLPFYGDGIVVLDASTNSTGMVNVFVVEDNVTVPEDHVITVTAEQLLRLGMPKTRFWLTSEADAFERYSLTDTLEFTASNGENTSVKKTVMGRYRYGELRALMKDISPEEIGFTESDEDEIGNKLISSLGEENICQNGILALRVF
ncbi:MAG: metallophosphoesterase [Clostridia bacterium]|nr:metallophosphoesterase [Clostridia bacterium]